MTTDQLIALWVPEDREPTSVDVLSALFAGVTPIYGGPAAPPDFEWLGGDPTGPHPRGLL